MDFCDKIATLCIEKYDKLAKCGKPLENKEWTHLSAIVQDLDEKMEVVSLATGTKCIGASSMSTDGSVVNDSHAEVSSVTMPLLLLFAINRFCNCECI